MKRMVIAAVLAGAILGLGSIGNRLMAQGATFSFGAGAAATSAPAPKSESPYAKGGNPLSDPNFVPILVNIQSALNAKIYAEAGINVYSGVDDITLEPNQPYQFKPTAETLKMLSDAGILLIADQDVWKGQMANPTIIGWESPVDEPDNAQSGTGKAMPLDAYMAQSKRIKETDPTRPYFVCFGQGVANDGYRGRGMPQDQYPKYMGIVDFIQYDVYPITNIRKPDGEKYLEWVGQGISKIRKWSDNKPALCWIETTHIKDPAKKPTPAQTACEVWITMVHGARGVGYFCHDFTLTVKQASALSRDKDMLAQLKITNAKLKKLALAISAPLTAEPAVAKGEGGKVIFSTKKVGDMAVVIAVNVLDEKAKATIPVPGLRKGQKVEVREEAGRSDFQADSDGGITADFAPYQEHVYVYKVGGP